MKIFLYLITLLFGIPGVLWAAAGQPEKIEPQTKIIQTTEWYGQQAELWKTAAEHEPQNAQAWLNYYLAARFASYDEAHLQNSISPMAQTCPQSFEYQYIAYRQGQGLAFLERAYALQPDNPLTYGDFIRHHEQTGNRAEKERFCHKWLQSKDLPNGLLSYCHNILQSVGPDGILFNAGENTTLPLWVLQNALHIRADVTVLDIDLLARSGYRKRVLTETALAWQEPVFQDMAALQIKEILGNHLFARNPGRSFYFALSLPWPVLNPMQAQLYVVGLASQLSRKRLDNIGQLRENLENRFLMDYVRVDFNADPPRSAVRVLNANYLAPVLLLQAHYRQNGQEAKADNWRQLAIRLARDQDNTGEVMAYLEQGKIVSPPKAKPASAPLEVAQVEKSFKPVFGKLRARQTEVTNREYQQFLDYLLQHNRQSDYAACKPDVSAYEGVGETFMRNYHTPYRASAKRLSETAKERSFTNHPVLNIPHQAAVLYCHWLTEQYNSQPERAYKKVKFRLPTLNEWRIAAIGAAQFKSSGWLFENLKLTYKPRKEKTAKEVAVAGVRYPWWRVFPQLPYNESGCYLSNFRVDSSRCDTPFGDGFGFTGPVGSYFANDLGLYDMVGNVAEMIGETGKACGGSWNHPPGEATITSVMDYAKPDSRVGFRVFMEIIEERK